MTCVKRLEMGCLMFSTNVLMFRSMRTSVENIRTFVLSVKIHVFSKAYILLLELRNVTVKKGRRIKDAIVNSLFVASVILLP